MSRKMKPGLKVVASLLVLVVLYPVLVWGYCLLDDHVLRRDAGKWEYHNGTFWHTHHFADGSDPQYDRQIDLCCPPYFNLRVRDRQP
jgi:hypothetical protein